MLYDMMCIVARERSTALKIETRVLQITFARKDTLVRTFFALTHSVHFMYLHKHRGKM